MKKLILTMSTVLGLSSVVTFASDQNDEPEFRGNWTASFPLKDGSEIVHLPNRVQLGFISSGKSISLNSRSYNGIPMDAPLMVLTNMTKEDFIEAVRISGLLNE